MDVLSYQNNTVKTSVRKLVEFLLRSGDIETGTSLVSDPEAMQEGSRLHRKIQRSKKAGYRSEVALKMSWHREDYELVLEGRAGVSYIPPSVSSVPDRTGSQSHKYLNG